MTPDTIDKLPYRPCVGITLLNPDGLVFVGHRINSSDDTHWQMPQGGIDDGENPFAAAVRELEEETGATGAELLAEARGWYQYDIPLDILRRSSRSRFRGQRQKWFALRHEGGDSAINIATQNPEFDDWKWVKLETVVDLIVPFKKAVYEQVVLEFKHLTQSV